MFVEASLLLLVYPKISPQCIHLKTEIVSQPDIADEERRASQSRVTNVGHWQKVSRHELQVKKIRRQSKIRLWESMQATDFARTRLSDDRISERPPPKKENPKKSSA